ncbi:TonB-dependent receptor [Chitinophaga ginsengisegetis]|uniref:TonB-dependent receptor n=1 Tax=Chitinophaga ginsengisegetis TaxID=393003 RepID=UPI00343F6BA1
MIFFTRSRLKIRVWTALLVLILTVPLSSLFAQQPSALLSKQITLSFSGENLLAGLNKVAQTAQIEFAFNAQHIDRYAAPVASYKKRSVNDVLNDLLRNTPLTFRDLNGYIVINEQQGVKSATTAIVRAPGTIGGKVADAETGQPIAGATFRVGNKGTQTAVNGAFSIVMEKGRYTAIISHVGYVTKEISDIVVKDNETFTLDIMLKKDKGQLKGIVVRTAAGKENANALLLRQKNAAEISNGISAEQIARTPDKNIGESLKRISGVSIADNRFVLIRGIGERYNAAMLDGVALPSTEAQNRNFSFDLIPAGLVDNVVVSKTVTPDMNVNFGGGAVQINTRDIPNENLTSITAGVSYNDQSTGKDFLSHQRGKYDYLGFDDGRRNYPAGLQQTDRNVGENIPLTEAAYEEKLIAQSKRFKTDNISVYRYKTAPSQNYQLIIGRVYALDSVSNNKLGFTGAATYRNTQNINIIEKQNRGDWYAGDDNPGKSYSYNTTLGGLLNIGLQWGKNRLSLRNTYTHMYDNVLVRNIGYNSDNPGEFKPQNVPSRIQEADDPTYTDLLQNKLSGQHMPGKVKIEWNIAHTAIRRNEKDMVIANSGPMLVSGAYRYVYGSSSSSEPRPFPLSRHHYSNRESHNSWDIAATVPFNTGSISNSFKAGYFGSAKKADFDWQIVALAADPLKIPDSMLNVPLGYMINPDNFSANGYFYMASSWWNDRYAGKSNIHAGYLMLDTKLASKLRLVWGVRAEYYKYTEIKNGLNIKGTSAFRSKEDKPLQWLPSANITYSPASMLNIRAAFSSSVVRPELMENSQFWRYSPYLGAMFGNEGVYSTRINSYDLKAELFPAAGDILSVGGFYKNFDKPAELTYGNLVYYLRSADWAKVYGIEFELRKRLDFIGSSRFLNNLIVYGNYTLQRSSVRGTFEIADPAGGPDLQVPAKQKRPMYGQSPYLYNAGLQYSGRRLGWNVALNGGGYKTYVVAALSDEIEYEKPRQQLDLQISYKLLNSHLEIKLNAGNLLNSPSTFFTNRGSYEKNPDYTNLGDYSEALRLKPGFSDKYEPGDLVKFSQKFGRTYGTTVSYHF